MYGMSITRASMSSATSAAVVPNSSLSSAQGAFDTGKVNPDTEVVQIHSATPLLGATVVTNSNNKKAFGYLTSAVGGITIVTLLHTVVFNPDITSKPSEAMHLHSEFTRGLASIGLGVLSATIGSVATYFATKGKEGALAPVVVIQEPPVVEAQW